MTIPAAFTIFLLIATLVVMSSQRWRADLVAVTVLLVLILSRILTPAQAFGAFGQPVIPIIVGIYIIGAALYETGVATLIANRLQRFSGRGEGVLILIIVLTAGLMSSVLSGLLVTAVLMPAVLRLARQAGLAPSRLLLPLVTAASVGNQATLLGTTSNIVISDLLASSGYEPLGLFSLTPYGMVSLGLVLLWYLLAGRRLLRRELPREPARPSLDEVERSYRLQNLLYRLRVRSISDLIGQRLADSPLPARFHLNVVAVQPRGGEFRPVTPDWVLEQDDILIVEGDPGRILQAATQHGLEQKGTVNLDAFNRLEQETLRLAEAIVPFRSQLAGQNLTEADFRQRYGLNVLAVQRQGRVIRTELADLQLTSGDSLLVQGPAANIRTVGQDLSLVLVTDLGPQPGDLITGKARLTLVVLGLMLAVVVSGLLSLATAMVAAAVTLVATDCISLERAYKSINGSLLVVIGGMLPLAMALQQTGAAELIARTILEVSHSLGPLGSLIVLYLLTSVVTQVIANTVVAALFTPIALNLAVAQGLSPQLFAIAVAFAVNAAYVTPLTDANNLFVQKAGQYTMRDYLVNGLPLYALQTSALVVMFAVAAGWIS
jgi:di/tricarboxylate transporter